MTVGRLHLFNPDEDYGWHERAKCRGLDPDLFIIGRGDKGFADALAVCDGCPVRQQCLDYALRSKDIVGVWGGTTGRERKRILKERRTAA